ncbi:MAG: D-aminoacyl-tRNA deacylase [Deltaproteobacteria bacterium]
MRAVIQRVTEARVDIEGEATGRIGRGLLILLGAGRGDDESDAEYLAEKISSLRIFEDEEGRMNHSVTDAGGEVLVVSQFTLYGDCRRGRRPSFDAAMPQDSAENLYNHFVDSISGRGLRVETGRFGAQMQVHLVNSGPVTILLDSKKGF